MASKKRNTDPRFPPVPRNISDTLPDGFATVPFDADATTTPSAATLTRNGPLSLDADATTTASLDAPTDPGPAPTTAPGVEPHRVEDVLRNMKGARVWSPPAASSAESQGAAFAAYHALGAAAKRHETPMTVQRVVLDITTPGPAPASANDAPRRDDPRHDAPRRPTVLIGDGDTPTVSGRRAQARRRAFGIFAATLAIVGHRWRRRLERSRSTHERARDRRFWRARWLVDDDGSTTSRVVREGDHAGRARTRSQLGRHHEWCDRSGADRRG